MADFNGDGRLDIAVADEEDDDVSILLSLGGHEFAAPSSYGVGDAPDFLQAVSTSGIGSGVALATASANSQDVVVLNILLDGTLIRSFTIPIGAQPAGQVLGDFNGDGVLDIAFETSANNQVLVRLGSTSAQGLVPEEAAPLPQPEPVVVDWNSDGTPDVFDLDQQGRLALAARRARFAR